MLSRPSARMRVPIAVGAPIVWALLIATSSYLSAQSTTVFKAETHLIDTTVSIHDAQGGLVSNMVPPISKGDLSVIEDGVPQTIRFFSPADQLPLSIGLVIDESGSQERFVKEHEHDIAEFLRQVLRPQDRAFAVCFANHLRLVSDWSSDQAAIVANLRRYDKGHPDDKGHAPFPELGPEEDRELGTAFDDAIYYATTERMAAIHQSRKVLIVFSDGEENSSEHDLIDTIQAAQDADVLVYAIRYTELQHGRMSARDRYGVRELDHITAQTGGKSYDAHAMKVSEAFAEIAGELRSLYGVAYQSTNHVHDGAFRKVVIESNRPGIVLRTRTGYYAK